MQEVRVININNMSAGTSHIMIREASSPNVRSKRLWGVGKIPLTYPRIGSQNQIVFGVGVRVFPRVPNELFHYQKIATIFSLLCPFTCISGMTRYLSYVTNNLKNILTYRKWILNTMSTVRTHSSFYDNLTFYAWHEPTPLINLNSHAPLPCYGIPWELTGT